jgi:hypothetical protein
MDQAASKARAGAAQANPRARLLPAEVWSGRSIEERARALESACSAAIQIVVSDSDPDDRLSRIDPVPASTMRIIRRLIANARAASDSG